MNVATKSVLTFWAVIVAVVAGTFAIVGGSLAALSLFMSMKAAGLIWCGLMLVGVVAFFSWMIYDKETLRSDR